MDLDNTLSQSGRANRVLAERGGTLQQHQSSDRPSDTNHKESDENKTRVNSIQDVRHCFPPPDEDNITRLQVVDMWKTIILLLFYDRRNAGERRPVIEVRRPVISTGL
jgi:hypothetical protein